MILHAAAGHLSGSIPSVNSPESTHVFRKVTSLKQALQIEYIRPRSCKSPFWSFKLPDSLLLLLLGTGQVILFFLPPQTAAISFSTIHLPSPIVLACCQPQVQLQDATAIDHTFMWRFSFIPLMPTNGMQYLLHHQGLLQGQAPGKASSCAMYLEGFQLQSPTALNSFLLVPFMHLPVIGLSHYSCCIFAFATQCPYAGTLSSKPSSCLGVHFHPRDVCPSQVGFCKPSWSFIYSDPCNP